MLNRFSNRRKGSNLFVIVVIGLIVCLWLIMANAISAADITKELTFEWEQNEADLPFLKEWRLYWTTTSGGPYTPVLDANNQQIAVPYDPNSSPPYTTTQSFVVPVPAGQTITYYFVMTAVNTDDEESSDANGVVVYSNEALNPDGTVGIPFVGPPPGMTVPMSLKVTVKVVTPSQ